MGVRTVYDLSQWKSQKYFVACYLDLGKQCLQNKSTDQDVTTEDALMIAYPVGPSRPSRGYLFEMPEIKRDVKNAITISLPS